MSTALKFMNMNRTHGNRTHDRCECAVKCENAKMCTFVTLGKSIKSENIKSKTKSQLYHFIKEVYWKIVSVRHFFFHSLLSRTITPVKYLVVDPKMECYEMKCGSMVNLKCSVDFPNRHSMQKKLLQNVPPNLFEIVGTMRCQHIFPLDPIKTIFIFISFQ